MWPVVLAYCRTPAQRNQDAPYSSPEIEVSLLEYDTARHRINQLFITKDKVQGSDVAKDHISMATLRLLRKLYASNGTTTKVVNSTPQGLWLGHDLARTHGNLDKQSSNHGITCKLA